MSAAVQLPRGRHGLDREQVRRSQRERILRAMIRAVAAKGYVHTTVADVIAGAGVSRETFYEQFADREDAFGEALERCAEVLTDRLAAALGPGDRAPLERFARGLAAYLDTLAAEPALARTFLIEAYAAGPRALRRRVDVFDGFVEIVADLRASDDADDRFACEALVGATSSLVTMRVAVGEAAALPQLHAPLMAVAHRLLDPQ